MSMLKYIGIAKLNDHDRAVLCKLLYLFNFYVCERFFVCET